MSDPPRIGLVGAGPWGHLFTAPMLTEAPDCVFAGVWARRSEAAHELANAHGVAAFTDLDALFDACDGVTFSVPPGVQAELAARAARAGKAVLLDKPVGLDDRHFAADLAVGDHRRAGHRDDIGDHRGSRVEDTSDPPPRPPPPLPPPDPARS